jgi:uncharacterized heparinase superfamily protein
MTDGTRAMSPGRPAPPRGGTVYRYATTLSHLRPVQFYGYLRDRVRRLVASPSTVDGVRLGARVRPPSVPFPAATPSLAGHTVTFLARTASYPAGIRWDDAGQSRHWRYHLHAMPFLRQPGLAAAEQEHLIATWIRDNADTGGVGWEPFPTSGRLVNWLRLWWEGHPAEPAHVASAAAQARHLRRFVEHYVHANHLFENLKALLWAGCAFDGPEAAQWRAWAGRRLTRELREQILPDGGHYERSPMYHSLVLEGCLDLLNIRAAWEPDHPELAPLLRSKVAAMLAWLAAMTHPDGGIALFNDATRGGAPRPAALFDYARRLGIAWSPPGVLVNLASSGYVAIRDAEHYLVLDVGPIGPDHQPGHGHCDLFSFEWSRGGQRVVCDSGVFAYDDAVMRPYVRSTAAHNTVRIDGEEQSDVWADFRVGRRARPRDVRVEAGEAGVRVQGAHSGYERLRGAPVHQRRFEYRAGALVIVDDVTGGGAHDVESFLHFHPSVTVGPASDGFDLSIDGRRLGYARFHGWGRAGCERGHYCPEFGRKEANTVAVFGWTGSLPFSGRVEIALEPWAA